MKTLMFRSILVAVAWGVLISLLSPAITPNVSAASTPYNWVDYQTISGPDGTIYHWDRNSTTTIFASSKLPSPSCPLDTSSVNKFYQVYKGATLIDMNVISNDHQLANTGRLFTYTAPAAGSVSSTCVEKVLNVTIGSLGNKTVYQQINKTTIQAIPGKEGASGPLDNSQDTRIYTSTDGINYSNSDGGCKSIMQAQKQGSVDGVNVKLAKPKSSGVDIGGAVEVGGCQVQKVLKWFALGNPQNRNLDPATNPVQPPATTGAAGTVQAVCSVDSLTWLVCPIISVAQGAVNSLTGVVKSQLQFAPLAQGETGLKPAWEVFRGLANIFFVLIFFVVIFGTSLGLDNYTVKKILPRLVAAAVLVQFSYLLVGFMVDITNVLGMGIDSLMSEAIPKGMKTGNEGVMWAVGGLELIGGIAGAAALLPFVAEFAIPLLLTLGSAIIALVAVFVTLQIRIMLIDFLIILSPIAFLLWVLPNTDKYFKMWRETLIKLLLMYPIIILLLATSKLFSVIITGAGDVSNWTKLSAALAPIIALFLIPATFKFASSALMMGSNLVSKASGRGKRGIAGMQDNMRQNRQFNRQQKSLSKINALDRGEPAKTAFGRAVAKVPGGLSVQRRLAQQGAGLGLSKVDDTRTQGALLANDKSQQQSLERKYEDAKEGEVKSILASESSSRNQKRAAISHFTKHGEENEIAEARLAAAKLAGSDANGVFAKDDKRGDEFKNEWNKMLGDNYSDLKIKSPHAVSGLPVFETMTAGQNASAGRSTRTALADYAITGGNAPARKRLLENLDINRRSTATVQSWDSNSGKLLYDAAKEVGDPTGSGSAEDKAFFSDIKQHLDEEGRLMVRESGGGGGGGGGGTATNGGGNGGGVPSGGSTPSGAAAPAPQPHATPISQPPQAQQVQTILEQHATQTSTPVGSVETQYTSDPTFKAQVDTAQAHNMSVNEVIRAQTPPKPISTPLSQPQNQPFNESTQPITPTVSGFGEGKTSSSGLYLPNNYPNSRQLVSSRLAPRDQTDEPGDDRSIS